MSISLIIVAGVSATVWTDPIDYPPGSTVYIEGDNSNNAGYVIGKTVQVDVVGPTNYFQTCYATVEAADQELHGGAYWTCPVILVEGPAAYGRYDYTATQVDPDVQEFGFTQGSGPSSPRACG